jgi:hydroxymethylpyrimidine pyrophosphatase-like HAD family hydrolase
MGTAESLREPGDFRLTDPPALQNPVRLIASDLDGTLLTGDGNVSPRTARAIRRAVAAGVRVVAATGRQVTQLPAELVASGVSHAVGSNGSIAIDLVTGEVLFEELLAPSAAGDIVAFLTAELEGVRFSAVRDHGGRHVAEPGYLDLLTPWELGFWRVDTVDLAEVVAEPTLKLTVRHPELDADGLLAVLSTSGLGGFHATTSRAPFVEIAGAGVTKATGVARLCALLGVDPGAVLASGDAKNDVELLSWAGFGVAMGNSVPEARAAADWTTAGNDDDGVALAIEHVLTTQAADR